MTEFDHLEYAEAQLSAAWERLRAAKRMADPDEDDDIIILFPSNVISECQECIELSVKAMFKVVSENPPRTHDIEIHDDQTAALLHAEFPEDFDREDEIPRAVFLTQIWRRFYEHAKYGIPEQNIRPDDIVTKEDAERAIDDADYCVRLASELLQREALEQGTDSHSLAPFYLNEEWEQRDKYG